jgi:hypothetical protein
MQELTARKFHGGPYCIHDEEVGNLRMVNADATASAFFARSIERAYLMRL